MKFPTRPFILLALFSTIVIIAAFQFSPIYVIRLSQGDSPYLRDFWDLESDAQGNSFRWSKSSSEIVFHNAGQIFPINRPVTLELRLAAARPPASNEPQVRFKMVGNRDLELGTISVPSVLTTQRFTIDPAVAGPGDWALEISSDTFQPPGDTRDLGISLRRATMRLQDPQLPLLPASPSLFFLVLAPLLLFLFAHSAISRSRFQAATFFLPFSISIAVVLILGFGLVYSREQTILYTPIFVAATGILAASAALQTTTNLRLTTGATSSLSKIAFVFGMLLLIAAEAWVWLGDQLTASVIILVAGAGFVFLSMRLRPMAAKEIGNVPLAPIGWMLLGGITLLALAMRVYRLDDVLFGLFRDETRMGLLGMRVLSDPTYRPIYEGPPISQSGLLIYLLALEFKAIGPSIFSLRLVGAIAGALTVPLVWLLARDWFPISLHMVGVQRQVGQGIPGSDSGAKEPKDQESRFGKGIRGVGSPVALVAAFGLAIGTMHVYYSRFTLPYVESPLLSIPAYIFLARALRGGRLRNYAVAGLFLGATQYASQISRTSILVCAFLVIDEILTHRSLPRNFTRGVLVVCVIAGLVLSPLLAYGIAHPNELLARTGQVSLFNDKTSSGEYPITLLWNNIKAYAGIFNIVGDSHGGHVVPTRPEFDPVFGLLFLVGFIYSLTRLRESSYRRVLFWLFASLLPGLLSIEAPAPLRILEAPAPTFILAGIGSVWLVSFAVGLGQFAISARRARVVAAIALGVLALFVNSQVYFGELGNDPRLWDKNQALSTSIGATLSDWLSQQRIAPTGAILSPDWFLADSDDRDVINFTTNRQIKLAPLSQATSNSASGPLIVRPNILGYWRVIIAWQPGTKTPAKWLQEDEDTLARVSALSGDRQMKELVGPNFPDSIEPTFWLYMVQ